MVNVITGSWSLGHFDKTNMSEDLIKIVGSLEGLNDPSVVSNLEGMDFLNSFIAEVEGYQGHTEGFEEHKVYFSDDGSYQDATNYDSKYRSWTFYRRGWQIKDVDFSMALINEVAEKRGSLAEVINKQMDRIGTRYTQHYLPKIAYETLFYEPRVASRTGEYTADFGFLNGAIVDAEMLKPHAQDPNNLNRFHWRGLAGEKVAYEDFEEMVNYMSEYMDISDSNIVALGTRATLAKLSQVFQYPANIDIFERTGQPAQEIEGVRFIKNDFFPKDLLFFVAGKAPELITKLISPNPAFRGLAITRVDAFTNFEKIEDLAGSFFKIMPEGRKIAIVFLITI
ncbi:MAG: hypothetical protein ACRCZ9_05715 [Fusobacteriaceae bacterium]